MNEIRETMLPSIRKYLYIMATIFCGVHGFLTCIFFHHMPIWFIVYEIFITVIYFFMAKLIRVQDREIIYSLLPYFFTFTIIEVLFHSTLCILFTSMQCGFQDYIYVVIFFALFENYLNPRPITTIIYSVFGLIYLVVRTYIYFYDGFNWLDAEIAHYIGFANAIGTVIMAVMFAVFLLITIFKCENELNERVIHDKLTGLPNRHKLNELDYKYGISKVAMIDIDDFKKINDNYGHDVGDEVLKRFAENLKWFVRNKKVEVMRWGGEEFLVVFNEDIHTDDVVKELCLLILKDTRNTKIQTRTNNIGFTVTIGVANANEGKDLEELIKLADNRLYDGKNSGKNRVIFYNKEVLR